MTAWYPLREMPGKNGLCIATSLNCCGASPPTPTEIQVFSRGTCFSALRSTAGAAAGAVVGAVVGAGAVVGLAAADAVVAVGAAVGAAGACVGAAAGLAAA